jgi:predicted permease
MNQLVKTVEVVVPVFLVIVLGYLVGRRRVFDSQGAALLNRLVLGFALPASLFVSMTAQTRSGLFQQLPLVGLLAVGLLGPAVVVFLVLRYAFRRELHESALLTLAATQPEFAFMGIPILTGILGPAQAGLPIAVAGNFVNVFMVPLALILLWMSRLNRAMPTPRRVRRTFFRAMSTPTKIRATPDDAPTSSVTEPAMIPGTGTAASTRINPRIGTQTIDFLNVDAIAACSCHSNLHEAT